MTKCITLADDAYESLVSLKEGSESFSEVIRRITAKRKSEGLLALAGVWKNSPEMVKTMEGVYKKRKNFKMRDFS